MKKRCLHKNQAKDLQKTIEQLNIQIIQLNERNENKESLESERMELNKTIEQLNTRIMELSENNDQLKSDINMLNEVINKYKISTFK